MPINANICKGMRKDKIVSEVRVRKCFSEKKTHCSSETVLACDFLVVRLTGVQELLVKAFPHTPMESDDDVVGRRWCLSGRKRFMLMLPAVGLSQE